LYKKPARKIPSPQKICAGVADLHFHQIKAISINVADPGCPDPDSCPSRIPDPKTATKERRKKFLSYLFYSNENHKIESYFIFELV
jgi:hypothetical protein